MNSRQEGLLEVAKTSLSSASKQIHRYPEQAITLVDISRIQDAAAQAQQAAAHLNQLVGTLLADLDRDR